MLRRMWQWVPLATLVASVAAAESGTRIALAPEGALVRAVAIGSSRSDRNDGLAQLDASRHLGREGAWRRLPIDTFSLANAGGGTVCIGNYSRIFRGRDRAAGVTSSTSAGAGSGGCTVDATSGSNGWPFVLPIVLALLALVHRLRSPG